MNIVCFVHSLYHLFVLTIACLTFSVVLLFYIIKFIALSHINPNCIILNHFA